MAQTALATTPTKSTGVTLAPDVGRMQRRLDYLKRVRPNDPQVRSLSAKIRNAGGGAAPAAGAAGPAQISPEQASQNMFQQFSQQASQFDPATYQSQYGNQFGSEMERTRQNIMGTFQRRNAEEFARQQEENERTILERGLDPASPAAEALRKQLNVRQDLARQEAMSSAEAQAYEVQQQGFEQAKDTALMPGAIWQQFKEPFLGQREYEYQRKLKEMENRQRRWELRNQPRAGGGGGGGAPQPSAFDRYMEQEFLNRYAQGQGQPGVDPWGAAAQGFAAGLGQGVGSAIAG
jgi:hypothetical protein